MRDELQGFMVVKPEYVSHTRIFMRVNCFQLRLSAGAISELGKPDYVNVFVDECRQRILLKPATKEMENTFFLNYSGGGSTKKIRNMISNRKLVYKVKHLFGADRVNGHVPSGCEKMLIFERNVI